MKAQRPRIRSAAGRRKIGRVLSEFKRGTLYSGSGDKVTDRSQALAIGHSEARKLGGQRLGATKPLGFRKVTRR